MATKRPKSLKERIDALINALGGTEKPTVPKIRNELVAFASIAEALEDGQAGAKKEATIATLKEKNENLKVELQAANAKIERFQAEREKQEKSEEDIPTVQYRILKTLPSEHAGDGLTMEWIRRQAGVPLDETEIHVGKLEEAGLAARETDQFDQWVWRRTKAGNEFVVAKRLAGEEEAEKRDPDQSSAELSQVHQALLLKVAKSGGATAEELAEQLKEALPMVGRSIWTTQSVIFMLVTLRDKQLVIDRPAPKHNVPRRWIARRKGMEYLARLGAI